MMRIRCRVIGIIPIGLGLFLHATPSGAAVAIGPNDISFRNEVQQAIQRGLGWLKENQNTNGYWSAPDQPAVTALALAAYQGNPARTTTAREPGSVQNGYEFILNSAKPDGSIFRTNIVTY